MSLNDSNLCFILIFLDVTSLLHLSCCNKAFKEKFDQHLWENLCKLKLGLAISSTHESFKNLYTLSYVYSSCFSQSANHSQIQKELTFLNNIYGEKVFEKFIMKESNGNIDEYIIRNILEDFKMSKYYGEEIEKYFTGHSKVTFEDMKSKVVWLHVFIKEAIADRLAELSAKFIENSKIMIKDCCFCASKQYGKRMCKRCGSIHTLTRFAPNDEPDFECAHCHTPVYSTHSFFRNS